VSKAQPRLCFSIKNYTVFLSKSRLIIFWQTYFDWFSFATYCFIVKSCYDYSVRFRKERSNNPIKILTTYAIWDKKNSTFCSKKSRKKINLPASCPAIIFVGRFVFMHSNLRQQVDFCNFALLGSNVTRLTVDASCQRSTGCRPRIWSHSRRFDPEHIANADGSICPTWSGSWRRVRTMRPVFPYERRLSNKRRCHFELEFPG